MAKKIGMIEILDNFYATASPDAADLITKHAVKSNKVVQSKNGKSVAKAPKKPKVVEPPKEEIEPF